MNSSKHSDDVLVPAHIEEAAGREYMLRLRAAASRIVPMSVHVAGAFSAGPEVSGGVDADPDDDI